TVRSAVNEDTETTGRVLGNLYAGRRWRKAASPMVARSPPFTGYNVLLMLRLAGAGVLAALALVASGCSGNESKPAAAASTKPATCPQTWKAGWQRLANRLHETVYCPTWMPSPIDAKIGGQWDNGISIEKDRSYLVSFLWHE